MARYSIPQASLDGMVRDRVRRGRLKAPIEKHFEPGK
jgi:hypothetical protein